jgi:hypothetical protein
VVGCICSWERGIGTRMERKHEAPIKIWVVMENPCTVDCRNAHFSREWKKIRLFLGRDLCLYQRWNAPRLLRWRRLGLGRESLGFACEKRCEIAPFYRPKGSEGAVVRINAARRARHDETFHCAYVETEPSLRANNFCRKVGDGWASSVCQ